VATSPPPDQGSTDPRPQPDLAALLLGTHDDNVFFDQQAAEEPAAAPVAVNDGPATRELYVEQTEDSRTDTDSHNAPLSTVVEESEESSHHTGPGHITPFPLRTLVSSGFPDEDDPSTEGAVFEELDKLAQAEHAVEEEERAHEEVDSLDGVPPLLSEEGFLGSAETLKRRVPEAGPEPKRARVAPSAPVDMFRAPPAPRVTFLTED